MIGWRVAWKCLVAWRFGESSQQPTWPQVRHRRRWTHGEPIFKHSSQPSALGVTSRMVSVWMHSSDISVSSCWRGARLCRRVPRETRAARQLPVPLSDGSGNALDRTRAHITDREYAWQVSFERPLDVCAGTHETL